MKIHKRTPMKLISSHPSDKAEVTAYPAHAAEIRNRNETWYFEVDRACTSLCPNSMVMATSDDPFLLLSAVVPAFLTLSAFYISDNSDALAARAKLDPRESYFAKAYDELQILDETLRGWNQRPFPPESDFIRTLDFFESLSRSQAQVCLWD